MRNATIAEKRDPGKIFGTFAIKTTNNFIYIYFNVLLNDCWSVKVVSKKTFKNCRSALYL